MSYYYKRTEWSDDHELWTVMCKEGDDVITDSDWNSWEEAAARVNYLNGGHMHFITINGYKVTSILDHEKKQLMWVENPEGEGTGINMDELFKHFL